jgi:hypothetical protein
VLGILLYCRVKGETVACNPEYTKSTSQAVTCQVFCQGGNVSSKASGGGVVTALTHDVSSAVIFSVCVCLCVGSCFISRCVL